ncbi:hypothetical protein [Actinomadura hibisca]|uniref:hypothetical protein n=1 Tax=Actinomadura hibisca TaxID=68565 RepID=UPI00082DC0A4|nr:hypothetical protein [Actinomadura hibisca]
MVSRYRTRRRSIGIVALVYLVIGVFVAVDRGYITEGLVRQVVSALLAVLLWFLVLLGIDMHIDA